MSLIEIEIEKIEIRKRHRKEMGDLEGLAKSIAELGLLQPIGVNERNVLIFGERRLRACRDILKQKTILVRMVSITSILKGEYAENEVRKDFTPSERVALAKALEAEIPERRGNPSIRQNFDELKGRTDDIVAQQAGFGNHQTLRDAKRVVKNGSRKLIDAMDSGKVSISTAATLLKAPPQEQDKLLELSPQQIRQRARALRNGKELKDKPRRSKGKHSQAPFHQSGESWTLTNSTQPVPCRLLIAQPPFGTNKEEWQPDELEAFTNEWGSRWSLCGARHIAVLWRPDYLFEGKPWLDEALGGYHFEQLLMWRTANPSRIKWRKTFVPSWQPIFLYRQVGTKSTNKHISQNGIDLRPFDSHVAEDEPEVTEPNLSVVYHPPQLPPSMIQWLLEALSNESDEIATLYCEAAVCGIAAMETNRRYHGSHLETEVLKTATARFEALKKNEDFA